MRIYEASTTFLVALSVSADIHLAAHDERGPGDGLKLQFEAACRADSGGSHR